MGFIYFQKIQLLDFFRHLCLENSKKYWPIDAGPVKFWQRVINLLLFCVLHFNVFWTCHLSEFTFCLQASYARSELLCMTFYQIAWSSNKRFSRNQTECISTKLCSHNFLVNCAFDSSRSFSIHTNNPRKAGYFPIVLKPWIHWKPNVFHT